MHGAPATSPPGEGTEAQRPDRGVSRRRPEGFPATLAATRQGRDFTVATIRAIWFLALEAAARWVD
jgi:hypothetical protein